MEENKGKIGQYQRDEIAKSPLKGNKSAIDKNVEVEYMKIRKGETMQQWESRTQKLRILPEKEHEKREYEYKTKSNQKSMKAMVVTRDWEEVEKRHDLSKGELFAYKKIMAVRKRKGLVEYRTKKEPLFHFKYIFVIIRMLEVRYKIKVYDIMFLFHLYCLDRPFLKREFEEKAMVAPKVTFNRYMKLGIINRYKYKPGRVNYAKTGYSPFYGVSRKGCFMVKKAFDLFIGEGFFTGSSWYKNAEKKDNTEKITDLYYMLRNEIKEMEQGFRSDDKFYPVGLNMDELENPEGDGNNF